MTAHASESSRTPPGPADPDGLVSQLAEEMVRRWRQGEQPTAEEFLARHPELWACPESAVELIYEELCLRQEHGQEIETTAVLARFPQWRAQLQVLLECHRLLGPRPTAPAFPAAGEALGDFQLLAELGRGAQGRVFLATQPALADRPVVLKLTPRTGHEHLSLARLQHTHVVPLYSAHDDEARNLRVLCMPYFGGATLDRLLKALAGRPAAARTGHDLLAALDRAQEAAPVQLPTRGPARQFLARDAYVETVCVIAACLAEALHYAHERGLVHLDVKPSNVLLAADGQPMLLDFHLARAPLRPGGPRPEWLGGTLPYMPCEQQAALAAVAEGRPPPQDVDHRADVYSLGALLYEALGGAVPYLPGVSPPLHVCNPSVSVALSDVVRRCLAYEARARYATAAALAADLRRHLAHEPLQGVANRSQAERWRKWRRRSPLGLARGLMVAAVVVAVGTVGAAFTAHVVERRDLAARALAEGRQGMSDGRFAEAENAFRRGLDLTRRLPGGGDLWGKLDEQRRAAEAAREAEERAAAARELHQQAERARFLDVGDVRPSPNAQALDAACRAVWARRADVVALLAADSPPDAGPRLDLLDLAIFMGDLRVRLAAPGREAAARQEALALLAEAEATLGPNPALCHERRLHAQALGLPAAGCADPAPAARTAWEHYALGRSWLRAGDPARAADELAEALRLEPHGLWPNFYQGACAYHLGRYEDAVNAFSVCVGAAPDRAEGFYNRALAQAALGHTAQALRDFDQALRLDGGLAAAALNRGLLHQREGRYAEALADLQRALDSGADPAAAHYGLARVHLAQDDFPAAAASARRALAHDPDHQDARALLERLR